MAELLAVIAITLILSTVGIIAVTYYMRIMKHLEYDAMAKEIYIAAQNHLSMAYNEGYLGIKNESSFGVKEGKIEGIDDTDANSSILYYVVTEANTSSAEIFDLMLPFGSIEEKVRSKTSYLIRYDKSTGRVLDVFYSEPDGKRYGHTFMNGPENIADEYKRLLTLRPDKEKDLRRYFDVTSNEKKNSFPIVGYYGGDKVNSLPYGDLIDAPYIRVINNEELSVEVKLDLSKIADNEKKNLQLRLFIKGEVSDAEAYITLKDNTTSDLEDGYDTLLDSITRKDMHFSNLTETDGEYLTYKNKESGSSVTKFIPGENITLWVEAFDNSKLTNIARSLDITTNTLFGDLSTVDKDITNTNERHADISNIRHLENLDAVVSDLNQSENKIKDALQNVNLDFDVFLSEIKKKYAKETGKQESEINVIVYDQDEEALTANNYYYPVELPMNYHGQIHSISNIVASKSENAGLFSIVSHKDVDGIELIDFNIYSSGSAGALAGCLDNANVSNVAVHDGKRISSVSAGGNAGGLTGRSINETTIGNSLASVYVKAGGAAGGLIGYSSGSSISDSYSGAHTANGEFVRNRINVISTSGSAGGLAGQAIGTTMNYVYATGSVDGAGAAGGLVGYSSGSTVQHAYAVGYVKIIDEKQITNKGALIGQSEGSNTFYDCKYLKIANNGLLSGAYNRLDDSFISAVENGSGTDAKSRYMQFVSVYMQSTSSGIEALPYDSYLAKYYVFTSDGSTTPKYLYKGIKELHSGFSTDSYVLKHYGDYPAYETLAENIHD